MATRPPIGLPKLSRRSRILLIIAAALILLLLVGSRLLSTYVNWLWFGEVGFTSVFTTVLWTRIALFFAVGALVGGALAVSLWVAYRTRPVFVPVSSADDPLARYRSTIVQRVRLFGIGLPVIMGLIAGSAAQSDWQQIQLLLNGGDFGVRDPQFQIDIGFYAFTLPFITWLISWLFVTVAVAFFGALVTHYLFGGIRLAGKGGQLAAPARMQLSITAGVFVLVYAVDYFFERYELLFNKHDLFSGANYTDLNAVLPAKLILMFIAGFCAVAFFAGAFLRNLQLPAIATALLILSGILVGAAWPAVIQQFSVRPNENTKESLSIQRNIEATRLAYGLTDKTVKTEDYAGTTDVSPAKIRSEQSSSNTISNVRLLDPNILAPTFTQREGRENFYGFPEKLDVDRYTIDGKTQDYIVAAREIKTSGLTETQGGWINRHMVFTHGNGFVAAPANTINSALQDSNDQGGYPVFKVSDLTNDGPIKVTQPRIYFGELATDNYAIVGGKDNGRPLEYDTSTSTFGYTGAGGVPIDGLFNKLVFAAHYTERNILFSSQIEDGAKIMYNRNPRDRVSSVAPWLTLDGDPYPAVVNGKILWIIDGYTTLENYPYAQRTSLGEATTDSLDGVVRQDNRTISYIRNSVKATVDAYDGTVKLYSITDDDPVLKAWQGVFPGTVLPSSEISDDLRSHFRYPEDLFKVQRELLSKYHVSDAVEFFSQKTFWNVPADPTEDGASNAANNGAKQPPYYVLAQAPGQTKATFQITSALNSLNRQFLASWVSVSSDPADYGQIRVLRLPTSGAAQVEGPGQVQNRFQTTPEVAENRTLFNNPSVAPRFGNLLTLPVAGGLLFVEPIYIQRKDANAFPQLARVLVSFGNKVGFAPTIDEALDEVFGKGTGDIAPKPGETPNPPSSTSAPSTTPTTTPSPGTGGSELDQAVQSLNAAIAHLRQAQRDGDFTEQGKALAELDAAAKQYDEAKAKAGGQTTAPSSPGASPSPTPAPGG
ncbi:UPF0182 family protein [Actinokineospora globicatena]|uniref:UPF0182 family protein n=1 Tax=Actinokineospora globicatena TaxID=103729 RepID=UPI0020A34877|nr:UPF0182 family protein [Actinokineospora globicatena]MCP2304970.1 hypothetical protein [Actinokineospora globicatena]GLW80430.1 UPF0182 protein [Actinokineospora globicatena]GLW87258.1 UPF0182 protein [Actinokineospora globicatena]